MPSAITEDLLQRRFEEAGQGHVFAGVAGLDTAARAQLFDALRTIDLDLVAEFARLARGGAGATTAPAQCEPPEVFPLRRSSSQQQLATRARARGEELLRAGRVGFLLVAGGQASRLGYDDPKGCFPTAPLTRASLYEIFARKLQAARARHGARGPWYVMTSAATDAPTRAFFERAGFFGLPREDVVFFQQAMVPALDAQGRILMGSPAAPFLAPNGHGGVLAALSTSGALEHARQRGVDVFSYFQVDNPLAPPADPLFLGLHALAGARMSSKVVRKRSPDEKVGVLGHSDGRLTCIEYSDLPANLRHARDTRGDLSFWAGSIALHVIDRDFVEDLTRGGLRLPWHVAKKRIPVVDAHGRRQEVEGAKFEAFVFDALAESGPSVVLEVVREREFSPVKNKEGEDSPATARADQCRLFSSWAARAGVALPPAGADGVHPVEVDPRFAEDEDEFLARMPATPRPVAGGHLYAP